MHVGDYGKVMKNLHGDSMSRFNRANARQRAEEERIANLPKEGPQHKAAREHAYALYLAAFNAGAYDPAVQWQPDSDEKARLANLVRQHEEADRACKGLPYTE